MALYRRLLIVALLVAIFGGPALAAGAPTISLSVEEMAKIGIHRKFFALAAVSEDGSLVVGQERESNPKEIARGHVFRLIFFRLDWASGKYTTSSVWLPLTDLNQVTLSMDMHWVLCVGEAGMRMVAVDVPAQTAHVVTGFEKGQPGFRVYPYVTWNERGRFMAIGYFYDGNVARTAEAMVSVDPAGTSLSALTRVKDMADLNKATKDFRIASWFSSNVAVFGFVGQDKKVHLYEWLGGGELKRLDIARDYTVWTAGNRVLYVADRSPSLTETVLQDLDNPANKRVISMPGKIFRYPHISPDGTTIVVSAIDFANGVMSTYYARESEGWHLKPVPTIQDISMGTLRFSPGGKAIAFLNRQGVMFTELP